MITKTIDSLFIGTRYGVWALGILGILGSLILIFVNLSLGINSALVCVSTLLLSITIALALLPEQLIKSSLLKKRYMVAIISGILAICIMGIVYFINGGFPELNLLFM